MSLNDTARAQVPVAVVGASCRAPGGVTDVEGLWRLLLDERDAVTGCDPDWRWPPHKRVVPADLADARAVHHGAFLRDIELFDPGFFGIPIKEGAGVDPQHRLLMETTWEALENAGIPPRSLAGTQTGLFIGISNTDYSRRFTLDEVDIYQGISSVHSGAPGRISYILDVNGPSIAVDAACASSLVAVHLACRSLHTGESDLAVAGGVTVQLEWAGLIGFARAGALSARGRCAAFDAGADGFVRGEGCGMVALKRLPDAVRDGDPVLGVIRGTAVNHAGRVQGITQPSRAAQQAAIAAALRTAGVAPGEVGYIEAHGTGTPVGDPIEFAALSGAYGTDGAPCALGSIKTNIGHPESAAGVLGLIKAVTAARTGLIPANLHFTKWNPAIDAAGTRFYVPTGGVDWDEASGPRRAAVSSFGVTGTNAHVIVEQPPPAPARSAPARSAPARSAPARSAPAPAGSVGPEPDRMRLFAVSAASAGGLAATGARLADHLETARPALRDVAHTLALHRSHLARRACVLAADGDGLLDGLRSLASGRREGADDPRVISGAPQRPGMPVWVFSGHGSQWAGMARPLLDRDPAFTGVIDRLEPLVADAAGFSLRAMLGSGGLSERMDVVQPLVFAVQTGLARMWRQWGVRPAAVVGHSMGEAAAAVAAGILTPEDGMRITLARSAMLQRVAGGRMVSVALPAERVEAEIAKLPGVSVAVVTAPSATVVAGTGEAVRDVVRGWRDRGVFCRQISVTVAAHSAQVDPILDDLAREVSWLAGGPPRVPFYSTSQDPRRPVAFDAAYWARNLREPVRFDLACRALLEDGHRSFVELSPHPLLLPAVEESAAALAAPVVTAPSLLRDEDARESMCRAAARLHVAGTPVDLRAVNGDGARVTLPATAFDRARFWTEETDAGRGGGRGHMWLGDRLALHDRDAEDRTRHVWSADLGTGRVAWLAQHTLRGDPVVPGAAYVELMLAATGELLDVPTGRLRLDDVRFERLLPLADSVPVHVTAVTGGQRVNVEISHRAGGTWERVAGAVVTRSETPPAGRPPLAPPHDGAEAPEGLYDAFVRIGLDTGPAFHSITAVAPGGVRRVRVPEEAVVRAGAPRVHPVLLDGCILSVAMDLVTGDEDASGEGRPWLPSRIGSVVLPDDPGVIAWTGCELRRDEDETATGRADLYADDGRWVGALEGLYFVRSPRPPAAQVLNGRLFEIVWREAPPAPEPAADAGRWIVIGEPGDDDRTAERMARAMSGGPHRVDLRVLDESGGIEDIGAGAANVVWCATGDLDGLERVDRILAILRGDGRAAPPPRLWLASTRARPVLDDDPVDPDVCALRGLLRVASFEHLDTAVGWVDADTVDDLAAEVLAGDDETEVAWRAGRRHVARIARAPLAPRPTDHAPTVEITAGEREYALLQSADGGLDGLRLAATGQDPPVPGPGQVLIRPLACTLHFRDVMIALGIYPAGEGEPPRLGSDATGVVVAVGDGVGHVRAGDRVTAIVPDGGTMASHCLARAELTLPLPPDADPAASAPLALTYGNVWHFLHDVGRLSAGETVLVHSAAGGTGLAAVAVARLLGAAVLATAGTEAKRRHLRRQGVEHVFDSRDLRFAEQVRRATGGRGVDVVLNSLSGPAMHASLSLLAPRGRFVEIGKRDLYDGTRVDLGDLRRGNTYAAVDMALTAADRPEVLRAAAERTLAEVGAGRLPPLPFESHPMDGAAAAFKRLASGDHIGRIVLTFPEPGRNLRVREPRRDVVRPGGAYVITGATKGVGLQAARRLADAGAARVVLGGRSRPGFRESETIAAVRAGGCEVELVRGDVSDSETARRLVAAAGPDLRGVLHTAVVLDDAPMTELTPDRVASVWHPKVTGAKNLHEATAGIDLDWFVIFSSLSAMIGNLGQAGYSAAGNWVDAFARWRHRQGLPTLSVNWGAWGESGRATDFAERGFETITDAEGFTALRELIRHGRVNTGMFPYQPDVMARYYPYGVQAPLLAELQTRAAGPEQDVDAATVHARPSGPARTQLIQEFVLRCLAALLGADHTSIPAHAHFTEVGLDSLMAVALTQRLNSTLNTSVTSATAWANPSAAELAAHIDRTLDPHRT
ncbi:type I polyketide synthase [Actinomadura algeriensis]|uniref:Acyl transferase domain-containing protein/acyl carrier protein n=1 Tax=Actinomadura algeriensis TaxID=1679523 RepID=A0ABR9K1K3_9ACTN|nr:type I polyketide synthase [Actinomadura algeriensis]MBE1536725.1 acyl transferase domain-containing protein/acyl carrier protein [Actinomadura algeriensis]